MPILKTILNNNPVSYANAYINPFSNYNTIKRCKDKIIKFKEEHTKTKKKNEEIEKFLKYIKTNGECSKLQQVTTSLTRLNNNQHKIDFDKELNELSDLAINSSKEEYDKLTEEQKNELRNKKIQENLKFNSNYDPSYEIDIQNRGGKKSRKNKKRKNRNTRHNKRKSRK